MAGTGYGNDDPYVPQEPEIPGTTGTTDDLYSSSWLPKGTYAKWGSGTTQDPYRRQGQQQTWQRSSDWAGGVVWHPYWGWQSSKDVKGLYGQSQGPVSEEQFRGWGLTRNPGEDWKQYYEDLTGLTPEEGQARQQATYAAKQGGGTAGATGAGGAAMPNTQDWSSLFQSYNPEYGQTQSYNYPDEMNWATDFLGEYAATGRPVSYNPWYQQAKGGVETDVMDAIKQAAEKAGMGGMRYSSPMGRTAQDISSRASQDLGTQFMGYETQALENAANRGLTASSMLPGLAQQRQDMPMQYAQGLMGMGQGMNQSYNNMLNPIYQEWMRTQPEYSPWNQYAGGLLGQTVGGPQQYQQGCMSQVLGAGTSIASIIASLSSADYKKDIQEITAEQESAVYEKIKDTPLFQYRYRFEDESRPKHCGIIVEQSPGGVAVFDKMVGLYEYIGALHATVKTLIRKVEEMENA